MIGARRLASRAAGDLGGNYWRLWSASAASNLADGIFWIAFPLFAVRLTDSPALIAGVTVVGRLPWLVFVLFAGALADRLDRRRTMLAVTLLRIAVAAGLAVGIAADAVDLLVLYVTAFALGVGETLFDTAAQSIMPSVVRREQLSRANGRLYAVELAMNQFVGPPLGGILAGAGIALAFTGSALAFGVAAGGLLLLSGSFRPAPPAVRGNILADIREGLAYLAGHRLLRTLALMVGVMNLASTAAFAVFVLYAVAPGPMGLDEAGFGLLMTSLAFGSLAGSFLVERAELRFGRARLLAITVVVSAVTIAMPGLTPNGWLVGAAFAASGVAIVMWNVVTVSLRQRIVPDRLLGRVNASYRLLAWGSQPIGALLGGIAGELLGLPAVFVLAGVATGGLILAMRIVTDAAIVAAEREAEAAAAQEGGAAPERRGTPADGEAEAAAQAEAAAEEPDTGSVPAEPA